MGKTRYSVSGKIVISGIFLHRAACAKVLRNMQQIDRNITIEVVMIPKEEANGLPRERYGVVRTSVNGL